MEMFGKKKKKSGTPDVYDAFSGTSMSTRCYESHPVLKIGKGKLYGGSASHPKVTDADIYVALQSGSTSGKQSDPWEAQNVVEVRYSIDDMDAPKNVTRFKKMITWLCNQLQKGKTVHVGCIGGHGRTGTVLSAIVAEGAGKKDAIQWVREHYCKKAVESTSQVEFLKKHYGVSSVTPTKSGSTRISGFTSRLGSRADLDVWEGFSLKPSAPKAPKEPEKRIQRLPIEGVTGSSKSYMPMSSARSLWKPKK